MAGSKIYMANMVPIRYRRKKALRRRMVGVPQEHYKRLQALADRLETTLPDTVIAMLNFVESVETERGGK